MATPPSVSLGPGTLALRLRVMPSLGWMCSTMTLGVRRLTGVSRNMA